MTLILENLSEYGKKVWDKIEYGIQRDKTNNEIYEDLEKADLAYSKSQFKRDIREYRNNRRYFLRIRYGKRKSLIEEKHYRPVSPRQADAILTEKKFITKFRITEVDESTNEWSQKYFSIAHDKPETREVLEVTVYGWASQYNKQILSITPIEGIYNPDL